jgi:hypothetical protein
LVSRVSSNRHDIIVYKHWLPRSRTYAWWTSIQFSSTPTVCAVFVTQHTVYAHIVWTLWRYLLRQALIGQISPLTNRFLCVFVTTSVTDGRAINGTHGTMRASKQWPIYGLRRRCWARSKWHRRLVSVATYLTPTPLVATDKLLSENAFKSGETWNAYGKQTMTIGKYDV